jgi:predicted nucleotidyltransferase
MRVEPRYPTKEHEEASEAIVDFFSGSSGVEAVILSGSCARGKATLDSCVDITVLLTRTASDKKESELERRWTGFYESETVFEALRKTGRYSHVDLNFSRGIFKPKPRGWTSGPDDFELEIGNTLVYAVPLWEQTDYFRRLRARWLPYYGENLRRKRLTEVRRFCLNNLDHVPLYVNRRLYFQAFDRLYNAFQEFLQALFIFHRTYPIAYDKWIREQIEDILGMPELYERLPGLFEIEHFESQEIALKAENLRRLLTHHTQQVTRRKAFS